MHLFLSFFSSISSYFFLFGYQPLFVLLCLVYVPFSILSRCFVEVATVLFSSSCKTMNLICQTVCPICFQSSCSSLSLSWSYCCQVCGASTIRCFLGANINPNSFLLLPSGDVICTCWLSYIENFFFHLLAIQINTIQYNTIQYNTIQCYTIQYTTIQYITVQYNTIQYNFFHISYLILSYKQITLNRFILNVYRKNKMKKN